MVPTNTGSRQLFYYSSTTGTTGLSHLVAAITGQGQPAVLPLANNWNNKPEPSCGISNKLLG
jgi:hypothetical protein